MTREQALEFGYSLSVSRYVRSLGFECFPWQIVFLDSPHKRKVLNGARQSGKSTIVGGKATHKAKYKPKSLSIIVAATEKQAIEDVLKVREFISKDPRYPKVTRDSDDLIELATGSRIIIVPATEKSARGPSSPDLIINDEGSRIEDTVYRSGIRPMLTDNEKCELVIPSTPNGQQGFFYRATRSPRWQRYEIRAPWDVDKAALRLVPPMPEAEYRARRAADGILAWYSPRHYNLAEQQDNLDEMGTGLYEQEYLCGFVARAGQVFDYDEINAMIAGEDEALELGGIEESDDAALVVA